MNGLIYALGVGYVVGTATVLVSVWRNFGDRAQLTDYLWLSVWPLIVLRDLTVTLRSR